MNAPGKRLMKDIRRQDRPAAPPASAAAAAAVGKDAGNSNVMYVWVRSPMTVASRWTPLVQPEEAGGGPTLRPLKTYGG